MLDSERLLLDVYPSRRLILALWFMHVLAFISISMVYEDNAGHVILLLTVLIAASLVHNIKKAKQVRRVLIVPDGESTIIADGEHSHVHMLGSGYSSDWVTILEFSFTDKKKKLYTIIVGDSVNADMLRKLKTLLRISLFSADEPH